MKRMILVSIAWLITAPVFAVNSTITRHQTAAVFLEGETDTVTVDSRGTLQLARVSEVVDFGELLGDVWGIHSVAADGAEVVYAGTSPNGKILKITDDTIRVIYPTDGASYSPNVAEESFITNEHVFALAIDAGGRLLAGVSGDTGQLLRFDGDSIETLFEADNVQYIHAITLDEQKNIYLGTGPQGCVYRLNAFGTNAELIYEAKDKNILSIAVDKDGTVYAGSDERGIVYKINPSDKTATVLYDSEQSEITSILIDEDGFLYAAATSAEAAAQQLKSGSLALSKSPGKPESKIGEGDSGKTTTLKTASTDANKTAKPKKPMPDGPTPAAPKNAGRIYKISPDGFVVDIFNEMAVFYSMIQDRQTLLLSTGNEGQLFRIDPQSEERSVIYENKLCSQLTSIDRAGDVTFIAMSNPAGLVKLSDRVADRGTFTSKLIDAGQPARWGKLQIDAQIPDGCSVLMQARSGNVSEPNDPTFSDWGAVKTVDQAVNLDCAVGRYCQYRLTLTSEDPTSTPQIGEVAVAHVVPNLPPQVSSVQVSRSKDNNKPWVFNVLFKAEDDNKDSLVYLVDFRRQGRSGWINLTDKHDKIRYDWDSRTVEDGRYEIRVTADDRSSNTAATAMTGTRISDVVVIDNSAPQIDQAQVTVTGQTATLKLSVADAFSAVGKVRYTIDSHEDWVSTLPDDLVYDTTDETFTIVIDSLDIGEHVVALEISDDYGNTMYKTFEVTIE